MSRAQGVYDGYVFDFPWERPLTGKEVKDQFRRQVGHEIEGTPYIQSQNGEIRHVDADEVINPEPGASFGVTAPYDTA
ncbi:MAG: hypothetical protein BZ151_08865 [Desulfobacca sp. 4484_104]|nr:MAG: hypothetical protein BZ151_08865 [Desulfobacca sp. 4484_104]